MDMNHMRRTFIRSESESEVEKVCGIGEVGDHSRWQVEFSQILWCNPSVKIASCHRRICRIPFCTRICAALVLGLFFAAASSLFFMLHI